MRYEMRSIPMVNANGTECTGSAKRKECVLRVSRMGSLNPKSALRL